MIRRRRAGTAWLPMLGLAFGAVVACEASQASPSAPGPNPTSAPAATAELSPSHLPERAFPSGLWEDATAATIGSTGEWTNKVELADIDGDGLLDILFANGAAYETPGPPTRNQVFRNVGGGRPFDDVTDVVLGDLKTLTRSIKVRDLDADGVADIVLGTTFQRQSELLLGTGGGAFVRATERLPQLPLSVGDLEVGDVDADGDVDLVLADWGAGSPMANEGARVRLWLNDGAGTFTDATADAMPTTLVRFSWDLELLDIDNDWDLDVAVSAKRSPTSFLFENDGSGVFIDVTRDRLPHFTNNYEFEAMDLDGDGFLELLTINDGEDIGGGFQEHVFRNDRNGAYVDATAQWWPNSENPGHDDNVIVFLDVESDGDPDFVVGSLTGPERLMLNDGSGRLTAVFDAFDVRVSAGTLGLAIGDLNGDGRPDVVDAQGENPSAEDERVYFGTQRLPSDTAPPVIRATAVGGSPAPVVHARVMDGASMSQTDQVRAVDVRWAGGEPLPLAWYGEFLFRADRPVPEGATDVRVCASDRIGNEVCVTLE